MATKHKVVTTGGRKLKEFLRKARAAQARSKQVDVGFHSDQRYPPTADGKQGLPVAQVAAWNEYGREGQPEVPFFRGAIAGAARELIPIMKAGIDPKTMVLDERTAAKVGEAMKGRIEAGIVGAKLIRTRKMLRSVDARTSDADSE